MAKYWQYRCKTLPGSDFQQLKRELPYSSFRVCSKRFIFPQHAKESGAMHIALVIYGSLDEVSGGFLYDRKLVEHLQQRGHEVTVIPLPWRSYEWSLVDNGSHRLLRRMQSPGFCCDCAR
jgi:hypothetical protein